MRIAPFLLLGFFSALLVFGNIGMVESEAAHSSKSSRNKTWKLSKLFSGSLKITGQGYGKTEMEAKKAALADLASAIQVEVHSEFESLMGQVEDREYQDVREIIRVESDLPILGAGYTFSARTHHIHAKAVLTSENSLKLYEEKIRERIKEADSALKVLQGTEDHYSRYEILTDLLTHLDRYYKLKIVAMFLGASNIPLMPITEEEIKNRLRQLERIVHSLDLAARLVAARIEQKKLFVYPPTTRFSHQITPFASLVKDKLSEHLDTVRSPLKAGFFMVGTYEIIKSGIELTYELFDRDSNIIQSSVVHLHPTSYAGLDVEPTTINFDKLLHQGVVLSNDFRVEISTSQGRNRLLFKEGEEVELWVKTNRHGYFYLLGHVTKPTARYSYLLDIHLGEGKRKFVYYVNADDVNKWISLGKFHVVPPFGVESLQLIACTQDMIDTLPSHKYDSHAELYILSTEPEASVVKARASRNR